MWNTILQKRLDECKDKLKGIKLVEKKDLEQQGLPEYIRDFIYNASTSDSLTNTDVIIFCEKAIKLFINYTLRPKWTLLNFLFGKTESQSSNRILKQLKILPFYNFYINAISDLILETNSPTVTRIAVEQEIDSVNRSIYEGLLLNPDATKIKNLFLQVYKLKYGDTANILLEHSVPYSFISLFLSDKNFKTLLVKFKIISDLSEDTEIDLKTLIKILTNKYESENSQDRQEQTDTDIKSGLLSDTNESIDTSRPSITNQTTSTKQKSFWEAIRKLSKKISSRKPTTNKLLIKENQNSDAKELFTSSELETITKLIFQSDNAKADEFFRHINKMETWDEVTSLLKTVFTLNKVDIYNSNIVNFVDKLNHLFTELKQ